MSNKIEISERMILLMEYAVKSDIAKNESDYWQKIYFSRTNISNVKKGFQSFTIDHIRKACQVTSASADWVLGLDKNMFRDTKKTVIQKLKEVVADMENELSNEEYKISVDTDKPHFIDTDVKKQRYLNGQLMPADINPAVKAFIERNKMEQNR